MKNLYEYLIDKNSKFESSIKTFEDLAKKHNLEYVGKTSRFVYVLNMPETFKNEIQKSLFKNENNIIDDLNDFLKNVNNTYKISESTFEDIGVTFELATRYYKDNTNVAALSFLFKSSEIKIFFKDVVKPKKEWIEITVQLLDYIFSEYI